jgi:hypothetical protein
MINGVLVERTVKDVVPALKTNSDGLKQVLDELVEQYKSKQDEMEKWKVRNPNNGRIELTDHRRRTTLRLCRIKSGLVFQISPDENLHVPKQPDRSSSPEPG